MCVYEFTLQIFCPITLLERKPLTLNQKHGSLEYSSAWIIRKLTGEVCYNLDLPTSLFRASRLKKGLIDDNIDVDGNVELKSSLVFDLALNHLLEIR